MLILGVPGGSQEKPPLSLFCLLEALGIHVGAKLLILKGLQAQLGDFGRFRGSFEGHILHRFLVFSRIEYSDMYSLDIFYRPALVMVCVGARDII